MIYPINKEEIREILKDEFESDIVESPFQKIYGYKEEKLCAFIIFDIIYERMELSYIYVDSSKRTKKIASLLMEFMLEEAKKNDIKEISLEVSCENIKAISLYNKYGFKEVAKRSGYYKGIDGLLMTKEVI